MNTCTRCGDEANWMNNGIPFCSKHLSSQLDPEKRLENLIEQHAAVMLQKAEIVTRRLSNDYEILRQRLVEECEKLKGSLFHDQTQKIVEEHAAAERAIQNNGWVDFDADNTSELIDDENYLIRQQDSAGRWCTPHMAYWLKEEQEFYLLHTLISIYPKVDQYFRIPE